MTELYLFNKEEVLINIIPEDDFNNDSHVRELNSKWSFEFTTTFQYLNDLSKSNKVGFYDRYREFRLFKIIKEPEVDYLSDEVVVNCLNDCYEMSDQIIEDKRLRDGTARQALDKVLEGSSYEVGEVAELGNRTINFYDISRMEGLNNIIESYGGELDYRIEFDADFKRISHKYVDIKSRLGQDTGLRFTYDLNLESVVRKDVSESHCTVLYGRGGAIESGDGYSRKIKFTDVEWKKPTNPIDKPIGQTYIEDLDAIAKYGRIEGIYENSDIEEPGELLLATYEALQECKNPKLSYEVNAKDLASQNSDYDHLTVVLGDSVILLDEDYDLNLESRIVGFEESIKEESAEMKWIIGNVQSSFSSDNASSGQIIKPSTGDVDIEIDDDKFPDALPDVPIIEAEGLFGSVIISWTYESKSYYEYELYASKLESFNPDASNLIFRGKASSYHHQVKPSETWYYRARAINTHGRTTYFSSQVKASTLKIEDGTEYFEKAAIADALIGELRLDRGWVGQLRGNWIDAKQLSVTDGNGKRTLDIDSFGNVNLDVTSLKIKNNSVATESFVSNAKNDAINSANNNTTTALENHYTKSETDSKISVAKDEINLGVSSTYATKTDVASSINGVNSSISSLTTRISSAESKITDTAITNTVKKNFYTKEETENAITSKGYATQSQVQQTAENIEFKFTQTGGYNLIRNGNPKPNNYRHWWVSDNANWHLGRVTDIGVQTIDTNEAFASTTTFKVEPGVTYSFSCYLMAETNTKGTDVYFIGSANDDGAHTEVHHLYRGSGDGQWVNVKGTFTLGSNINYGFIRIDNNGRKDTSTESYTVVYFSEVQMVKGSECYPQWSPNPNEVYDGLTSIDKEGITVTASNVHSKTKMSADGFQLIRTTDNKKMFYVNQDGSLEMSGNFTQHDSNGKISIKIANNSYGCYDWLWDGDFVGDLGAFEANRTNTSGANQRFIGIANIADYGNQLVLGVRSSPNSTNFNTYIEIDNTSLMHRDYVTFTASTGFKSNAIFRNPSNNNNETGRIFGATNDHFYVACNYHNQLRLGYEKNGTYYSAMSIYRNDNTSAGCAIEYYADELHHNNVVIDGFLSVKGQKNRLVATENFGDRLLNAYETAECYFGDINEAVIGEDGEVKVELDEVFLETVNTTEAYQVFLAKYGEGDCYVSERHEKYFVIKGTPNLSVGFEVKAKQRGYEKERLKMAVDTLKSHQATSCSPCSEDEVGYTIDCETTINRA